MKQKEHLPFFGIGPYYVGAIAVIDVIGMILSRKGFLDSGLIPVLKTPMLILGILVALLGAFIWGGTPFFRQDRQSHQEQPPLYGRYLLDLLLLMEKRMCLFDC